MSNEWYTRFRVAWDPVAAPVQGYKLIYSPAGETRMTGAFNLSDRYQDVFLEVK